MLVRPCRTVVLTGGNTATRLYRRLATIPQWQEQVTEREFYFGDERCVPPDHPESNYWNVMDALFNRVPPKGVRVHRMEGEHPVPEIAAANYMAKLPVSVDMLLLSVGEDGHIASLFPYSHALKVTDRQVVAVVGPKPPCQRLTITPAVIASAKQVVVLAVGEPKRKVFQEALRCPDDIDALPARLVLNRTWFFGGLD